MFTGCLRYNVLIVGSNPFGAESELALDDLSLSPQCFGLAVGDKERGSWRYNMTDAEFCEYFGRSDCSKTNNFGIFESLTIISCQSVTFFISIRVSVNLQAELQRTE